MFKSILILPPNIVVHHCSCRLSWTRKRWLLFSDTAKRCRPYHVLILYKHITLPFWLVCCFNSFNCYLVWIIKQTKWNVERRSPAFFVNGQVRARGLRNVWNSLDGCSCVFLRAAHSAGKAVFQISTVCVTGPNLSIIIVIMQLDGAHKIGFKFKLITELPPEKITGYNLQERSHNVT